MSESNLFVNLLLVGRGVETCIQSRLVHSSLILLYSLIDTTGWLDSDQEEASKGSFIRWTENYLLKARPLACTALELYAARCGMLHTLTPNSKISRGGKVRLLLYAHGAARVEDAHRTVALIDGSEKFVSVHIQDLYDAWREGLRMYAEDLDRDPERSKRAHARAKQFFVRMSPGEFQATIRTGESIAL